MLRNSNHDTQPRVAPVTPPYDADTAAALEVLGPPIGIFRVFARRPDRAHGISGWGRYYLSRRCALSLRHRELLILRTTARCGAEYEWGVHVQVFAGKAGLTGEQIRSVTAGHPDDPCWTEPGDRAVLRAADALDRDSDLSDADWSGLAAGVGEEGAVDALLICGWYHAISYVARATRLAPEPGAPLFADFGASSRVGPVSLAAAGSGGAGQPGRNARMHISNRVLDAGPVVALSSGNVRGNAAWTGRRGASCAYRSAI
jgi:alkylhydroperoxidase family enzyme